MINKKYKRDLLETLSAFSDRKLLDEFLQRILTPNEYEEIAVRLQIFKLLQKGIPQREIAETLNVSIATVTRGSREFKYSGSDFSKFF